MAHGYYGDGPDALSTWIFKQFCLTSTSSLECAFENGYLFCTFPNLDDDL